MRIDGAVVRFSDDEWDLVRTVTQEVGAVVGVWVGEAGSCCGCCNLTGRRR